MTEQPTTIAKIRNFISPPLVLWLTVELVLFAVTPGDSSLRSQLAPKELFFFLGSLALVPAALRLQLDALDRALLAFVGAGFVSAALAIDVGWAFEAALFGLGGWVVFRAVRSFDEADRHRLQLVFVTSVAVLAVVALLETLGWVTGLSEQGHAPGSLLGQRNWVAHLIALSLPTMLFLFLETPRRALKTVLAIELAVVAMALVHTRTRAGWVAAALSFAFFAAAMLLRRRWLIAWAVALAVAFTALSVELPSRLAWNDAAPLKQSLLSLWSRTGHGVDGRKEQWSHSLKIFRDGPLLGVGPANWQVHYPRVTTQNDVSYDARFWQPTTRLVNSDWVSVLVERGALSVALLLAVAAAFVRRRRSALAWATVVVVVAIGALDSLLQLAVPTLAVAILLGAALPPTEPVDLKLRPAARWVLVALLGIGVVGLVGRLVSQHFERRGDRESLELAVAFDPFTAEPRFALAESYVLEGKFSRAGPHLFALERMLPFHPAVTELVALGKAHCTQLETGRCSDKITPSMTPPPVDCAIPLMPRYQRKP